MPPVALRVQGFELHLRCLLPAAGWFQAKAPGDAVLDSVCHSEMTGGEFTQGTSLRPPQENSTVFMLELEELFLCDLLCSCFIPVMLKRSCSSPCNISDLIRAEFGPSVSEHEQRPSSHLKDQIWFLLSLSIGGIWFHFPSFLRELTFPHISAYACWMSAPWAACMSVPSQVPLFQPARHKMV